MRQDLHTNTKLNYTWAKPIFSCNISALGRSPSVGETARLIADPHDLRLRLLRPPAKRHTSQPVKIDSTKKTCSIKV